MITQPDLTNLSADDKPTKSDILTAIKSTVRISDHILNKKEIIPFWNNESNKISEKIWCPEKLKYKKTILSSINNPSKKFNMGQSWFSIEKRFQNNTTQQLDSFNPSQFSYVETLEPKVVKKPKIKKEPECKLETNPKKKIKKNILEDLYENIDVRTLKIRIFPTDEEKEKLQLMFNQFRWYYNASITVFYNEIQRKELLINKDFVSNKITLNNAILRYDKYFDTNIRDEFRRYEYVEDKTISEKGFFVYDCERNSCTEPQWWKGDVHSRIPRGALKKFASSINSVITNYKRKNISKFEMKYRSKKNPTDYLLFEDRNFPGFVKKIKSKYWFTNKSGKRKSISFFDIFNSTKQKGIEIIYEKETDRYFIHYPVDIKWYPSEDRRCDKQAESTDGKVISLDPGVRKFMVGYDPTGNCVFVGDKASLELTDLLLQIDKTKDKHIKFTLFNKVKNMVSELHWKTISFLIDNYDTILLPDFRVSQMVKGYRLGKMTKRLMLMFSFHSFKTKLKYKCDLHNKNLIIVNECYTSKTCTSCGMMNDVRGSEVYKCIACKNVIDRDVNGSRNIFIKNAKLN